MIGIFFAILRRKTTNGVNMAKFLDNQVILVTGGTGSFGTAFIRHVLENSNPRKLIIFSRDELKQFDMQNAFQAHPKKDLLRFFLGDVRSYDRLKIAFRDVDYVVHAAALKQVPAAEYNPFEFVHTNISGAENVVRAAFDSNLKGVVALSTDKACSPINLYGATKLVSDKIFTSAQHFVGRNSTKFSVVRYGNVLGSRGSVIPFFRKLIADSADHIPITDERMTRFWIDMNQAIALVLDALENAQGGEIFVPKIPSMKITDLAKAMAPNLPQKIVGIRPGEKLHEVMIVEDDARNTFEMDNKYVLLPTYINKLAEHYTKIGAKQTPDGFSYASNTNTQWMDAATLQAKLNTLKTAA